MQSMRELTEQGFITDEYMESLEKAMHERDDLAQFEKHLNSMAGRPDKTFRGSGGNKKYLTKNQRKRIRKAQRKARKVTA